MPAECCLKDESVKMLCTCSYGELLSLLGKKWAALMLRIIHTSGPVGYNELFGQISGISPKAFSDKLKVLEQTGLIARRVVSERPLRVQYGLTEEGKKFLLRLEPFFSRSSESAP